MRWTLFAQEAAQPAADGWGRWLTDPSVLVFLVPIAAILVGGAVAITYAVIRHRERMAKIERGIDPDAKPPAGSEEMMR